MFRLQLTHAIGVAALLSSLAGCDQRPALTAPTAPTVSTPAGNAGVATRAAFAARAASVPMCHLTTERTIIAQNGDEALGLVGHVIFVASSAEAAHCSHGDHTPRPEKVLGDVCVRRIDQPTPNVRCAGEEQLIRPRWATPASF